MKCKKRFENLVIEAANLYLNAMGVPRSYHDQRACRTCLPVRKKRQIKSRRNMCIGHLKYQVVY